MRKTDEERNNDMCLTDASYGHVSSKHHVIGEHLEEQLGLDLSVIRQLLLLLHRALSETCQNNTEQYYYYYYYY